MLFSKKVADTLVTEGLKNADTKSAVSKANFGVDDLFAIAEDMDEEDFPAEGRWVVLSPSRLITLCLTRFRAIQMSTLIMLDRD